MIDEIVRLHLQLAMKKNRPVSEADGPGSTRSHESNAFAPGNMGGKAPARKRSKKGVWLGLIESPDRLSKAYARRGLEIDKTPGVFPWRGEVWCEPLSGGSPGEILGAAGLRMESLTSHQAVTVGLNQASLAADGARLSFASRRAQARRGAQTTRTRDSYGFAPGRGLGWLPVDKDAAGPSGGSVEMLRRIDPAFRSAAAMWRPSASAGIVLRGNIAGNGGEHAWFLARRPAQVPEALKLLSMKACLMGEGGLRLNAAGGLMRWSSVDASVGAPEHLMFEGAAVVGEGLEQAPRRSAWIEGGTVDAGEIVLRLTREGLESRLRDWEADERARWTREPELIAQRAAVAAAYVAAGRTPGEREARACQARMADLATAPGTRNVYAHVGALLASSGLMMTMNDDGADVPLRAIMDEPERFQGRIGCDPLEGVAYGRTTAIVGVGKDGQAFIASYAHGGTRYHLVDDDVWTVGGTNR